VHYPETVDIKGPERKVCDMCLLRTRREVHKNYFR